MYKFISSVNSFIDFEIFYKCTLKEKLIKKLYK